MLRFVYGSMFSGKSATIIGHVNFNKNNKIKVFRFKIKDNDIPKIISRAGISCDCELIDEYTNFEDKFFNEKLLYYSEIIIDEAQFLSGEQVKQLHRISRYMNINCFGLALDNSGQMFIGSKCLFECADYLHNRTATCPFCDNINANINARYIKPNIMSTKWILDKNRCLFKPMPVSNRLIYIPMCRSCFSNDKYETLTKENIDKALINLKRC